MATHPMPPSLIAILRSGCSTGYPDHSHSAHEPSDSWPNSVAASWVTGAPGGYGCTPELPTCNEITVSVSTHAAMIGSQWSRSHNDGRPTACGRSGNVTERNPRSALRRISPAASAASAR